MAGDLFAPPTSDELQKTAMFAAPSPQELQGVGAPISSDPKDVLTAEMAKRGPTPLESATRGAAQGVSLGFADEIAGGGGAAIEAAKKLSVSDLVKDYVASRDKYRTADEAAKKANPKTFMAGQMGGGLATALVPGLNIAKGATLAGRAAGAAALGGFAGLGNSQADVTQGQSMQALKDAGIGFATGAAVQPAMEKLVAPAAGYIGGKIADAAGSVGKKFLNTAFDVPEAVSTRYLANPDAVNNALAKPYLGQKIADTLGDVRGDTGELSKVATGALSTERNPVPGMELNRAMDMLGKFDDSKAQEMVQKLRADYVSRASGLSPQPNPGYLTESEMHQIKKTLQGLTDFKNPLPSADQAEARMAQGSVNQMLKSLNPEYKEGMEDVAQNIQAKNRLANQFALKPDYTEGGSGFAPTDRTMSAMKDIVNGNKFDRAETLGMLKEQGYGDLAGDVQNTLDKELLTGGGRPNGSRKAVMFATAGGALGHMSGIPGGGWTGSAIGGLAGGTLDKYGPQIAKKGLDAAILTKQLSSTPGAQKFIGAIKDAASRGQGALAATHFILSQQSPEYQQATSSENYGQ